LQTPEVGRVCGAELPLFCVRGSHPRKERMMMQHLSDPRPPVQEPPPPQPIPPQPDPNDDDDDDDDEDDGENGQGHAQRK
jgi:hypothetical protein